MAAGLSMDGHSPYLAYSPGLMPQTPQANIHPAVPSPAPAHVQHDAQMQQHQQPQVGVNSLALGDFGEILEMFK